MATAKKSGGRRVSVRLGVRKAAAKKSAAKKAAAKKTGPKRKTLVRKAKRIPPKLPPLMP